MTFLSPWTIALAAGLTLPPLIALYFLKLKRNVKLVPSTLLWKRAVEDLHVNSPFQRLKNSLLLLLQLLLLVLGVLALGKPMLETAPFHRDALILLIDQSASMGVVEADGRSRLQRAKDEARRCVDNLADGGQAMVIAFCDRATVVSSFDTDKAALGRKIDSIEQTQSSTSLREAVSLAEAYAQTMIIGGEQVGADVPPDVAAPPAKVFLFTDGRIEDAQRTALERFEVEDVTVHKIGARGDNVGILAMDARRNYERPEFLEVAATVANFGDQPQTVDAVLYVDGRNVDMQTVQLGPAVSSADAKPSASRAFGAVAFENIEFTGSGIVQVTLHVDDALSADDRAWSIIEEPRRRRVLLVEGAPGKLESSLSVFPLDLTKLTGKEYESADDKLLLEDRRSAFDVVIFDRHSTSRLPPGNYFFWGAIPKIEGVSIGDTLDSPLIFNWDETHPVLRYVGVETLHVYHALELKLPREAVLLIEGETAPLLAHLIRGPSRFLIGAFGLMTENKAGQEVENTVWTVTADFVIFLHNALTFLGEGVGAIGGNSSAPGQTIGLPIGPGTDEVTVLRPDGVQDKIATSGVETFHYARTQHVGPYRVEGGLPGQDSFAVNLFNPVESQVAPTETVAFGSDKVQTQAGTIEVNRPAWTYFLLAMLVVLLLEWVVYNRRVFV